MRIFWLLSGNEVNPSSRIHGLNIHKRLKKLNFSSFIVHQPFFFTSDLIWNSFFSEILISKICLGDVIIVQKLDGPKTVSFLKKVKELGVNIFLIDCDLPLKLNVAPLADMILCPSNILAQSYINKGFNTVEVIQDAVEVFRKPNVNYKFSRKAIWFGKSGLGKWEFISNFKKNIFYQKFPNWKLITLSDHKDADYKWDIDTFSELISKHDLSIIPIEKNEINSVKSANRCTQSMALGVPVLTNNLNSYNEVIINNENGFMSDDWEEWEEFLKKCENPSFLNSLRQKAYDDSLKYSIENITQEWIKVLNLKEVNFSFGIKFRDFILFSFLLGYLACSKFFYERKI